MRHVMATMMLVIPALLGLAGTANAQYELGWAGPLQDGTEIRIYDFYADAASSTLPPPAAPGAPGKPGKPFLSGDARGDARSRPTAPARSDTIWAVFGDAASLPECSVTEIQGPVLRDGDDGVFTVRLGDFAPDATVTVFFVRDRDLDAPVRPATTGVDLGAGSPAPPEETRTEAGRDESRD